MAGSGRRAAAVPAVAQRLRAGGRGRGESAPEEPEPVIGLPGAPPATTAPGGGRGR